MFQAYCQHVLSLWQECEEHVPTGCLPRTCQACCNHVLSMFQSCAKACAKHVPSMCQACAKHVLGKWQTCAGHVLSMCQICANYVLSMCQAVDWHLEIHDSLTYLLVLVTFKLACALAIRNPWICSCICAN